MAAHVEIRNGSIYMSAENYNSYFSGLETVIILIRDDYLQIFPVMNATSGGYLMKIRNARGDRVISAPDIFHAHGLADWQGELLVCWQENLGALCAKLPKIAN